ncbi:hypothetical protein CEE45_14235 [Candidatus Heimdallarchaeota archaeon B3_Heim]|nr:MAG: hypothetical protein CEE45_14235 [Candidatus Heimdallarchaeota archaeon B3_Heim]
MNLAKHRTFYLASKIVLILLMILPIPKVALGGETLQISTDNSVNMSSNIESTSVYLFTYHPEEKELLKEHFEQNGNSSLKFFENLHIGKVSLSQNDLSILKNDFGQIFSRVQSSKLMTVLPSLEELTPKYIQDIQQDYELPSDIINASPLTISGYDGSGVKIAILDSGLDTSHSDFVNVGYQESFVTSDYGYSSEEDISDLHGHGTHVAGIAAGGGPFPGVATGSELVNLKVADMFGSASSSAVIAALDRAVELNVDIISISLGFGLTAPWESEDILALAVNSVVGHGITVVTAAGNEADGSIPFMTINTPASAKKALTVGATNGSQNVVSFSSQGPTYDFRPDPDIVAPGYQIIGPLASGGVIDLAYNALVDVYLSDYIVLSGTSMAAPVVSGAVALLLDQFPDASPYAIRAALQESASDLGGSESIYTQGSGLVNVGMAADMLKNSKLSSGYELISTVPEANGNEIEFFQPVSFPGDHVEITLPFVTGTGGTITWEVSNDLIPFIDFDLSPTIISSATYFEKVLAIDIPFNAPPDSYQGFIRYSFEDQTFELPIAFEVQLPDEKIYWDTYHTGKDDSYFYNYHYLNQLFQSSRYDIIDYNSPILSSNLTQNGILVLTDLEDPLTYREIDCIIDFHKNNGSILLVTSFLPYYTLDPYEKLISALNLPLNLSDRTELVEYIDDGQDRIPVPYFLSKDDLDISSDNPFFVGVENLPRLGGTAFYGNKTDQSLAHYAQVDTQLVLAGLEPEGKGKVLLLGSEEWIYSSYLRSTSGQIFLSNVLDWLSPNHTTFNVQVAPDSLAMEVAIYPSLEQNFSLTIELENGSQINDINVPYNGTLTFAYLDFSLAGVDGTHVRINLVGDVILGTLNVTSDVPLSTSQIPTVEEIEVHPITSLEIPTPSWWDNSDDLLLDRGLDVAVTHTSSSNISAILIISSQYEDSLDVIIPPLDSEIFSSSYMIEEKFYNYNSTLKLTSWLVPGGLHPGYYTYEIQVWWENEQKQPMLIKTDRDYFYVPDEEPVILGSQSFIGDRTVDDYLQILTFQDVPKWKPAEEIEISLSLYDENSVKFEVYYQLIHYYLFAADRIVFDSFTLNPSSLDSSVHTGIFTVPDLPIPLPDEEDLEVKIQGEYFLLLFYVRDAQGNSILEPIFFQISNPSFIDIPLLILAVVFALGVTIAIIYFIRRNERKRYDPYSYSYQRKQSLEITPKPQIPLHKYCVQCGVRMPLEAKFCSSCGKTFNS